MDNPMTHPEQEEFERQVAREYERINFMFNRDGLDEAIFFAKQTHRLYGQAINAPPSQPCMARTREHKKKFIASQVAFEEFFSLDVKVPK